MAVTLSNVCKTSFRTIYQSVHTIVHKNQIGNLVLSM